MDSGDSVDGSPDEPKTPNRGRSKKTKKETESVLKQKSPAEFFAENKNIAGFDNPGKSLYTTIRELVENALDSAEAISQLPDIELVIVHMFIVVVSFVLQDNGRGMPHDEIPNMFGRVLSGTKYGLKQTRGKFGLGAKMVPWLLLHHSFTL
ncbi:hypothetical protein ZIOFF_034574 [Zingiber officinale]|uniref:Histidine kinase/HSP90-like ATPase domain-containing protein n=1 Tax=Zingiber officinale TaxID=94328 RepID=A0A8J5L7Y2_ZINOF|nr:hypothetical protein ZIOFF_034574 [Zingiber officinale]